MQKKIALLHRYPEARIKETNAAFPFLKAKGMDVLTFRVFDRLSHWNKFIKSFFWIFYAPMLVIGKRYDVIYCDDSYPFYPYLVKMVSPRSKVILRIGDFHLMYYTHGLVYKILHKLEVMAWKKSDGIIAISEAMAEYIKAEIGRDVMVVNDPVDPADFPTGGKYDLKTVMFHGVLTKNKNVDVLLEAAKLLPEMDFVVVGDGPDLKRLMKLGSSNVFFLGWAPFRHVAAHIASCSVGVALRSSNPGNEYVVTSPFLQYGIMGKPCLVTRRKVFGTYPWQFTNAHELARKIKEIMKCPWVEGHKLRDHIVKNHDAKKISEDIWSKLQS